MSQTVEPVRSDYEPVLGEPVDFTKKSWGKTVTVAGVGLFGIVGLIVRAGDLPPWTLLVPVVMVVAGLLWPERFDG